MARLILEKQIFVVSGAARSKRPVCAPIGPRKSRINLLPKIQLSMMFFVTTKKPDREEDAAHADGDEA
jgi:hypothetical protein